ncbi:MAG: gliding motility lipoprotein GldH [Bacteroidota bacterium]
MRYLLPLCLFLTACGPATLYEAEHALPDKGWTYGDVTAFTFTVTDTTQAYDLFLNVTHQPDFAYQNFYVLLYASLPSGTVDTQRVSLQLAGDFGSWLGDCGSSGCTLEIPILENVTYRVAGEYGLRVEQFSRDNPLAGVNAVGMIVQERQP